MIGKNIVDLNVIFCDVILMLPCQTLDKHTIALLKMDFSSNAKSTIVLRIMFYVLKYKFQI
jgi:hypothetical protein